MDLLVSRNGSLVVVTGMSAQGHQWLEANVGDDQTLRASGGIVFEPRYVPAVVEAACGEGLSVREETVPVRAHGIVSPGLAAARPPLERGR